MQQTKVTTAGALLFLVVLAGESRSEELYREGFEQGSRGEFHLFKAVGGSVQIHETGPSEKVKSSGVRSFLIDCTLKLDARQHKRGEVYAYFYLPMTPSDPRGVFCQGSGGLPARRVRGPGSGGTDGPRTAGEAG